MGVKRALFGEEFRSHNTETEKVKRKQWGFQNRHQSPFNQFSYLVFKEMMKEEKIFL